MLQKINILIFYFVCFPYIQITPALSDVSPYWLILAFIAFLFNGKLSLVEALCIFAVLASISFSGNLSFSDLRGVIPALGFLLAMKAGQISHRIGIHTTSHLRLIVSCYIICGLIQIFIHPDIFTFLTSRDFGYAGRGGRGVESLTPEPTFLGFLALVFLLVSLLERDKLLLFMSMFLLIYISRSSSALLTLFLFIFVITSYIVMKNMLNIITKIRATRRELLFSIFTIIICFIVYNYADNAFGSWRVYKILSQAATFENILSFPSINDRLSHIYGSYYLTLSSYFIPHGYGVFYSELRTLKEVTPWMGVLGGANGRIMSLNGSFVYELGFIGLFILILFYQKVYKSLRILNNDTLFTVMLTIGMILACSQAIPVGFPTLPYFIAYYSSMRKHNEK